jgi:hypothetical protein
MKSYARTLGTLGAIGAFFVPLAADATTICKWIDENGRTQLAEVVPERYRSSATCTDSRQHELPAEQARQAQQRAANDKAAASRAAQRAEPAAPPAASLGGAAPAVAAKRPAQGVTDATDCETWRRLYQESEDCFGPYRTTRGATKAEAFEKCNPIPSPELKCGPLRR